MATNDYDVKKKTYEVVKQSRLTNTTQPKEVLIHQQLALALEERERRYERNLNSDLSTIVTLFISITIAVLVMASVVLPMVQQQMVNATMWR